MIDMLNVVKEKLELSPDLRKKINCASKYTSTSITLEKGALIKLEQTNIAYVDPHIVIINNIKFLFFNGVDCFYINSLNDKYEFSELELDDLKKDLKLINQKLDTLTKQLEEEKDLNCKNVFTLEKVMVKRDINRLFLNTRYDNKFFLNEWDLKTKEEKQEFISKYIESLTFKNDKNSKHGIKIVGLKLKSLFKEKVNKLSEIGASEYPVYLISNNKPYRVNVGYPLKESQIKEYLNELNKYHATNFYIHPTFNHTINDIPDKNYI